MEPIAPQPGIMDIALYQGGISHVEGVANVVKLSSNENPFGPPEAACEAVRRSARDLHRYPSSDHRALRAAIGVLCFGLTLLLLSALDERMLTLLLAVGVATWLAALAWLHWRQFGSSPTPLGIAAKALFAVFAFTAGASAIGALTDEGVSRHWFMLLLLVVWGADVGAYFTGRFLGRRKLAPRISPGKTWEGVWGGQATVILVCIVAAMLLDLDGRQTLGLAVAGVVSAAISVIGDLTVSLMKRQSGLKDSGRLLPGHGGVLDRFDSFIAALPIFVLCLLKLDLPGIHATLP